jgi:DNA (cytosine-5)-methyltransferase 1
LPDAGTLLRTPCAAEAEGGPRNPDRPGATMRLSDQVREEAARGILLPSPVAEPSGSSPEAHLARKPGREVVTDLAVVVENGLLETGGRLLPTPEAKLATSGPDYARFNRAGSGGPDLVTAVAMLAHQDPLPLLPTPTTQDAANNGGPSQFKRNTPPLNTAVLMLPTPRASDHKAGGPNPTAARRVEDGTATLGEATAMLPTPRASDGEKGGPNQRGSKGDLTMPSLAPRLPIAWGDYEPAIRRWERVMGPAPSPVQPGAKGQPRLSPAFTEWMMGQPAGWITAPEIGLTRNEQLKACGNGVVTQQAEAALAYMLAQFEEEDAA